MQYSHAKWNILVVIDEFVNQIFFMAIFFLLERWILRQTLNFHECYDLNFFCIMLERSVDGEQEDGEKKKGDIYGSNHFDKIIIIIGRCVEKTKV